MGIDQGILIAIVLRLLLDGTPAKMPAGNQSSLPFCRII
jgi:hypothetical protein